MRITLDIDDRVLAAARNLARRRGISLGGAVTELARRGLMPSVEDRADTHYSPFPVMVGDEAVLVTDGLVGELREG